MDSQVNALTNPVALLGYAVFFNFSSMKSTEVVSGVICDWKLHSENRLPADVEIVKF